MPIILALRGYPKRIVKLETSLGNIAIPQFRYTKPKIIIWTLTENM